MRVKLYQILSMCFCVFLLSGCGSARFDSTLRPSGNPQLTLPERFNIAGLTVATRSEKKSQPPDLKSNLPEFNGRARVLYPHIFVDDWTAVPITATAFTKFKPFGPLGPMLTGFTMGLIPFSATERSEYEVNVSVVDERGEKMAAPPVKFTRENGMWMSLLGPLGCLPVPGRSLLPRDTVFFDLSGDDYMRKSSQLTTDSLVEALVTALKELPPDRLAQVSRARQARLKEVRIDGVTYWSFLTTAFSKGLGQQEKADQFVLLLYGEKPRPDLQPVETAVVARRDGNDRWQPVSAYLKRTAKSLVSVTALLENGLPGRLVVTEVSEPPLEDFISVQTVGGDLETAEAMRWSNKVLLQAKNRSLPGLLQQKATPELLDLITQVENSFLELNRMSETAKDRAQKAVAEGGDGETARELSLTCRERGDILKPILSAMKQEVARRGGK